MADAPRQSYAGERLKGDGALIRQRCRHEAGRSAVARCDLLGAYSGEDGVTGNDAVILKLHFGPIGAEGD